MSNHYQGGERGGFRSDNHENNQGGGAGGFPSQGQYNQHDDRTNWGGKDEGFGNSEQQKITVQVPNERVGRVIGKKGSKIRELQDATGTTIKIQKEQADDYSTPVDLFGGDFNKAQTLIEELINPSFDAGYGGGRDSNRSRGQFGGDGGSSWNTRDDGGGFGGGNKLTMDVAKHNIGKLIGKRGAKIQELQEESGARIKIKKEDSDGYTTPVDLIGSDGAIQQAKEMIDKLFSQAESGYRNDGGFERRGQYGGGGDRGGFGGGSRDEKITIQVANSDIGKVIGKGGSKIRELQDESRARIKIVKEESDGYTTPVDLVGSEDATYRAKEMIEELINQAESGFRNDGGGFGRGGGGRDDKITIQVPNDNIGKLIGKGGSKIRELQDHSGARIKIQNDNAGEYDTPVDLLGSAESTKLAQELIEELMAPQLE